MFRSNDQDSDLDNNKSEMTDEMKSYMNGFLSTHSALVSCTACGKVLESEKEYMMHSQTCEAIGNRNVHNVPTKNPRDMMPPRFPCDACDKKFKRKEHLIQHRKLHTGKYVIYVTIHTFSFFLSTFIQFIMYNVKNITGIIFYVFFI